MSKRKNPNNAGEEQDKTGPLNRRDFLKIAGIAAGAAAVSGAIPGGILDAAGKPPVTTPTITCAPNGTDGKNVIDVTVCAPYPGTGLPAGFSVQWMTCDDFENGTVYNLPGAWPTDSDAAAAAGVLCKASFSGNAKETIYNLAAGNCLTVYAGSFSNGQDPNNPDNNPSQGYSTTCSGPLECDTCYVFRAFGHATSKLNRSAFSLKCDSTTNLCEEGLNPFSGCTKSQGYFKNYVQHKAEIDCAVANLGSNNPINGVSFTSGAQAAAYLGDTGPGSPSTLKKQLLALALNIAVSDGGCANYCSSTCVKNQDGSVTGCEAYPAGFGNAVLCGIVDGVTPFKAPATFPVGSAAALNGQTVNQVFDTVNGGGTYGLSVGDLTTLLDLLNLAFHENDTNPGCCGPSDFGANHLFVGSCPA